MKNLLRFPEAKVVLSLLLLLALLEAGARLIETRLSADVKHIRELPSIAQRLKEAAPSVLKVLIIGNSLSRDGLDQPLLKESLARLSGRPVELAAMYPDSSNINQWFYGYRRYFDQAGARPDVVFIGTGRPHLLDARSEPDRIAAFYSSLSDLPHLLARQQGDVEAVSKALLARGSYLFAHRGRVQPLVFYNLVPGYTETTQALAVRRPSAPVPDEPGASGTAAESCHLLAGLLHTLQNGGTRVFITTIPMTVPYELPPCVGKAADEAGAILLAEGAAMHLEPARFPDGYHLDEEGSRRFTQVLAEKLARHPEWMPAARPAAP